MCNKTLTFLEKEYTRLMRQSDRTGLMDANAYRIVKEKLDWISENVPYNFWNSTSSKEYRNGTMKSNDKIVFGLHF